MMSSIQKINSLLLLVKDFKFETSNMKVPSLNHWITQKGYTHLLSLFTKGVLYGMISFIIMLFGLIWVYLN